MNIKALLDAEFFPHVIRPARYIGNEWGAVRPRFDAVAVRLALCVPEKYDRGMGHPELQRLYRSLNQGATLACERAFLPDTDAANLHRAKNIPLFTLESFTPLSGCDWVHFLLPDALAFGGIISALNLAGIPSLSVERGQNHPVISVSGMTPLNPEPVADFVDFAFIGDLDAEAESIAALLSQRSIFDRESLLRKLAQIPGVYVPKFGKRSEPVRARRVDNTQKLHDITPIQAFEEVANDRLCVTLPNAFDVSRTVETVVASMLESGYDELAINADLAGGVKNFDQFITMLGQRLRDKHVTVALPPLPANQHAVDYANAVAFGEKQTIRFDLKSGSERLREAHGHFAGFDQFYQILANAYTAGWKTARLEFEIGLPEENDGDIDALVEVIRNCESIRRNYGDKTHLVIGISPFVPAPFTQWQWDALLDPDEYQHRCEYVQRSTRARNIQFKIRSAELAYLKAILARGDNNFAAVVNDLADLSAPQESADSDIEIPNWRTVLESRGIDLQAAAGARKLGDTLPWSHLEYGSSHEQLLRLRQTAFPEIEKSRSTGRFKLGDIILSKPDLAEQILAPAATTPTGNFGRRPKRIVSEPAPMIVPRSRVRLQWTKDESVRYVGHLATMRMFERAIRRAGLPVAFSQGFHARPKLSFGPPLTLGFTSRGEYFDIQLDTPFQDAMIERLNDALPQGFYILQGKPVFGKAASVSSLINLAAYEVRLTKETAISAEKVFAVQSQSSIIIRRIKNDAVNEIDVRDSILNIELGSDKGVHLLYMELALGNRGFVRPDEILSNCFGLSEREILSSDICRTALMVTHGESRLSPFEVSS